MINCSNHFDLGRDKNLIKDVRDGIRQTETVENLLQRFFHPNATRRVEIQILADEVGMGKTFVALGAAYSVLSHLKQLKIEPDLDGCYKRVLVLTPNNHALFKKWGREVLEFTKRCVAPEHQDGELNFAPQLIERIDDLAVALRKGGRQPQVLIGRVGLFGRDKLIDYELKRRFLLGTLFRFWGVRFNYELRERLLKGAPDSWPHRADHLTDLTEDEDGRLPFTEDELLRILSTFNQDDQRETEALLEICRELAVPFFRDRNEAFRKVESKLTGLYRLAAIRSIKQDFPLLIVDEAHHWKNGPEAGTNGFGDFAKFIAPHIRRTLLLTATPFQLRPDEMLEIMKVSETMQPCPTKSDSQNRVDHLNNFREQNLRPALQLAEQQSRNFSRAWSRLPAKITTVELAAAWNEPRLVNLRDRLIVPAGHSGPSSSNQNNLRKMIDEVIAGCDPDMRQFLREALSLFATNADLSCELGKVVIRHRRHTEHRSFRVGVEYQLEKNNSVDRPDRHLLHAAPGLDIRGEAELPQFLLMRCVSEMKKGKGRSSLGSDLTGCYSTLLGSAQGRSVQNNLKDPEEGAVYLDLLMGMVGEKQDPKHPKLAQVVTEVIDLWRAGQKVLIFCVRVNTAERLRTIISERIGEELNHRRKKCLGGEEKLKSLRSRLTGRDRDLVGLGLDRFLWSLAWSAREVAGLNPAEFVLTDAELNDLARLSLLFEVDLDGDRIDRVFLNRATEHLLAQRILRENSCSAHLRPLLQHLAELSWIASPYGLNQPETDEQHGEETASFDERGCHTKYEIPLEFEPTIEDVEELTTRLVATRQLARTRKQIPILDGYGVGPSLWFGADPLHCWTVPTTKMGAVLKKNHEQLWKLRHSDEEARQTVGEGAFDFYTRALVLQALRRALLRESVLLRLLPERDDLEEAGWGELLTRSFFEDLPGQRESMADRILVFLEDLCAASGDIRKPETTRGTFYQATRLRDQQFVALVKGGGSNETRERIFGGFNSPLLPEILICTAVGQEGIDLHRHCRHVVHYDLPWNPAVLEQRTGRADRIGSKTFREREVAGTGKDVVLDIGVPFLAGTYDERTFEELRLRAQTFEVLTGGDFTADHVDTDEVTPISAISHGTVGLVTLPENLVADLRVKLEVFRPD